MSETPSSRSGRSRRSEHAQHLYTARAARPQPLYDEQPPAQQQMTYTPNEEQPSYARFTPNEAAAKQNWEGYTPNEERRQAYASNEERYQGYTPNEPPAPAKPVNYAAYYSRESNEEQAAAEPAFAPPPKMEQYAPLEEWPEEEPQEEWAGNVYRPREVSWTDESREEVLAQSELGYQVQDDLPRHKRKKRKKRRRVFRALLVLVLILALLAAALWLFRDQLMEMTGMDLPVIAATEEPYAPVATPQPIQAYDEANAVEIGDAARTAISRISGALEMETYIVTDSHIVTRNQRSNGSYDFYVFTAAEGRLLCYFEGLGALDLIPQENGTFYVAQEPYLVSQNGSALIRLSALEESLGDSLRLHPMYRGWAVVENETDGSANYINQTGQLISTLWFSRTFPMTGEHTLAYVDTGATAGEQRYLLYVVGEDGTTSRWLSGADMSDAVASACGMAYLDNGLLYRLPDTSAPVCQTPEVHVYLDCDAVVVKDAVSGKYGLFVHGERHYDYLYNEIRPVESELNWTEQTLSGKGGSLTVHAVSGAEYPQPLSHSFVLTRDGVNEYVALSTQSSCPVRVDGEF